MGREARSIGVGSSSADVEREYVELILRERAYVSNDVHVAEESCATAYAL